MRLENYEMGLDNREISLENHEMGLATVEMTLENREMGFGRDYVNKLSLCNSVT